MEVAREDYLRGQAVSYISIGLTTLACYKLQNVHLSSGILQWFCEESAITRAISTGHPIAVADVRLDDIPDEVADTDFVCVQEYFKPDAWDMIQQAG